MIPSQPSNAVDAMVVIDAGNVISVRRVASLKVSAAIVCWEYSSPQVIVNDPSSAFFTIVAAAPYELASWRSPVVVFVMMTLVLESLSNLRSFTSSWRVLISLSTVSSVPLIADTWSFNVDVCSWSSETELLIASTVSAVAVAVDEASFAVSTTSLSSASIADISVESAAMGTRLPRPTSLLKSPLAVNAFAHWYSWPYDFHVSWDVLNSLPSTYVTSARGLCSRA